MKPNRFQTTAGLGVEATVDGHVVMLGNLRFLNSRLVDMPDIPASDEDEAGLKIIRIAIDGKLGGELHLSDQLRPETSRSIEQLRKLNIAHIIMLTGDDVATAKDMAGKAGITEYRAGLLPAEKVLEIRRLAKQGTGIVMVGDGVNDAPALASADVGVAMGAGGTDLAIESADVVLMSSDLGKLVEAIAIGRRALRILWQNLLFASAVIITLVFLALSGFLPMSIGVVGHEGSTLLVVLNGLRLLAYRFNPT